MRSDMRSVARSVVEGKRTKAIQALNELKGINFSNVNNLAGELSGIIEVLSSNVQNRSGKQVSRELSDFSNNVVADIKSLARIFYSISSSVPQINTTWELIEKSEIKK